MPSPKKVKFPSLQLVCKLVWIWDSQWQSFTPAHHLLETQVNLMCHRRTSQAPLTLHQVGHPRAKCQKFMWSWQIFEQRWPQFRRRKKIPTCTCAQTSAIYKQFPRLRIRPHRKGVKVHMRYFWEKKGIKNISALPVYLRGHHNRMFRVCPLVNGSVNNSTIRDMISLIISRLIH